MIKSKDTNKFSFSSLDFFGVSFNFLIDGRDKFQTFARAIISMIISIMFIILFFGFGVDLYERKNIKASINSLIGPFPYITLDNSNFTYAYRLEDFYAKVYNDTSKYRIYYTNFHYYFQNDTWHLGEEYNILESKLCKDVPNFEENQKKFNI